MPNKGRVMAIRNELIDELLKDYKKPEDILGESGQLKQLTNAGQERCLQGEMTHHLGYAKNDPKGKNTGNSSNGGYSKVVIGDHGEMCVKIPGDRNGSFDPQILPKEANRFMTIGSFFIRPRTYYTSYSGSSARDVRS